MRKVRMVLVLVLLMMMLSLISVAIAKEPSGPPGPKHWVSARADYWEEVWQNGERHYLAVWDEPYGHNPHFHGLGGDRVTCCNTHRCIGNWTWWLTHPKSKLGVPKSFRNFCGVPFGSKNIHNYSATVWMD